MYYKAVKDGKVVDVFSDSDIVYIISGTFGLLRSSSSGNAIGVLASDSSVIYMFDETQGYDTVTLVQFEDEATYTSLKAAIEAAQTPEDVDPEEETEEETDEVDTSVLENAVITAEEALDIILGVA